jgi:hypothetical protein
MLEYGTILGLNVKSFFSSVPISEMLLLLGLGIALIVVGYSFKGVWGAGIAFLVGAVLFLYFRGLLPFWL